MAGVGSTQNWPSKVEPGGQEGGFDVTHALPLKVVLGGQVGFVEV